MSHEELRDLVKAQSTYRVSGTTTTIVLLVLHTGFVVIGKSACVNADNFDVELGCARAKQNAYAKLAAHEAYLELSDLNDLECTDPLAGVPAHFGFSFGPERD